MNPVLLVDRVAVGGDGIAREPDGRVVFVTGALPGERVRVEITKRSRDYWRAAVAEVLEASADRREPPCPWVARGCGGCDWQHVHPSAQHSLKVDMVRDALARQGRIGGPQVEPGARLPDTGYRTTVRLAVGADGVPGFRRARSHDIVPVEECLVAHPVISQMLATLRAPGANEVILRVSEATGEINVVVIAEHPDRMVVSGLPEHAQVGPDTHLHEMVAGQRLRVSAASFFQSSARSADLLVDAVRRAVGRVPDSWVDLYAGVGLFAATLWPDAPVTAVEVAPSSCDDARVNLSARAHGAPWTVEQRDVAEWEPIAADVVVADPSRSGLDRVGSDRVAATGASQVVLVSCDIGALGRDARLLVERGYRHVRSEVLDLFPNTVHAEVVTSFERSDA